MSASAPAPVDPPDVSSQHQALVELLRQEPRGSANRHRQQIQGLIQTLEQHRPADLATPASLELLEGVWELRWSSSQQPYLAVGPWLDNLQLLSPSQGLGMNLLRLAGPFAPLVSIAVEAAITVEPSTTPPGAGSSPRQRVQVRFQRGGWLGPALGAGRLQLLRRVQQSFTAWLDITVLDHDLRICRGQAGTLFALVRRHDLNLEAMLLPEMEPQD